MLTVPAALLRVWLGIMTAVLLIVAVTGTVGLGGPVDPWVAASVGTGVALLAAGTAARPHTWLPGAAIAVALAMRLGAGPGPSTDPAGAVLLAVLAVAVHSCAAWSAVLTASGRIEGAVLVRPAARVAGITVVVVAVTLVGGLAYPQAGAQADPASQLLAGTAVIAALVTVGTAVAVAMRAPRGR